MSILTWAYYSTKAFFFFVIFLKILSFFCFFCFFALLLNAFNWIVKTLLTLLQPIFNKNRAKIEQD
ncbi:hypothetical protein [Helicobacter pylori]|uniref:hypothetical protein n=1 Tax=Helicobacter pylori TaxID=210 RepID=UPI001CC25E54|nr:hypothetical protein [Helicobacter pylori]